MMRWHAIIPFNHGRALKTRLGGLLSSEERLELALAMAGHVVGILSAVPVIDRITVVSPERSPLVGPNWIADQGRGLNGELAAARDEAARTLFIHADLPLLETGDVAALLGGSTAIAADSDRQGTNALALFDAGPFTPFFGADSLARHRAALPAATVIERTGLALDIDSPVHLARAAALGMPLSEDIAARLAEHVPPG